MKILRYSCCVFLISTFLTLPSCLSYSIDLINIESQNKSEIVLVTGFGPFDIYDINPSQLIVENLDGQIIDGKEIVGIILPVDFSGSVENITAAIESYNPDLIISTGLSPRAKKLNIEKIGVNIKMYPKGENLWFIPRKLEKFGPPIRFSTINTKLIVTNLTNELIPSRQSYYAGFYICNAVLYGTIGYLKEENLDIDAGFIHVPLLTSQDPEGMELETMIDGVELAIRTCLTHG
jgi:pyroglutamyl-peptidase